MQVLCALLFLFTFPTLNAQGTFDRVFEILQTNCASCHGGSNPIGYDLGTTPAETYAALVGVTPLNPSAAAKGHKRIDPGHPYNSFLLKKIGANLDGYFNLDSPSEGQPMPATGPSLSAYEAELIRQWILTGAKQTGTQVDTAIIWNYYNNGGQAFQTVPAPPAAGTGFQIRFGPLFIPPQGQTGSEIEYLKKEHLNLPANMEVVKLEGDMSSLSHHFLLFKFDDSAAAAAYDNGLRIVTLLNTATDGAKQFQNAWQYDQAVDLPAGTAFYYDAKDWLDLNYHIRNSSPNQILPADFFLNVYTIPRGSGRKQMRARLVNNANLFLLPGNNSLSMNDTWGGDDREIWMITSHTHKYGTDFDIFVRDSTGSRGEQIYEGFYNQDYTFNQGFYDWAHPATRTFDTLYTIKANQGLIFDTKYVNTSGSIVTFGLTTNDEMQLSTYLYVNKNEVAPVGTPEAIWDNLYMNVYPNPSNGSSTIDFGGVTRRGEYQIIDAQGKILKNVSFNGNMKLSLELDGIAQGVYFLNVQFKDGKHLNRKILIE